VDFVPDTGLVADAIGAYPDIGALGAAAQAGAVPPARENEIANGMRAQAKINHGRWVIECPLNDPATGGRCGGAQLAHPVDHRFYCITCLNYDVGGRMVGVDWPAKPGELAVEVLRRPLVSTRNWEPRESVSDLRGENARHGVK
jgi:hypothetical protein